MTPTRLDLASSGLRTAIREMASGEERAHALLDAYRDLPPERRAKLPQALAALDRIDGALHDFRLAVRDLEGGGGNGRGRALVQMRERLGAGDLDHASDPLMAP